MTRAGRFVYNEEYAAQLGAQDDVCRLQIEAPTLSPVAAFIDGRHRLGELFMQAPSRDLLDAHVAEALSRLALDTV